MGRQRNPAHPNEYQHLSDGVSVLYVEGYGMVFECLVDTKGCTASSANLCQATNAENNRNKGPQKNNTSGYKGVSWSKAAEKWEARIRVPNGEYLHLGLFLTAEDAARAYNEAAVRYHSPFAYQNQIGEGS